MSFSECIDGLVSDGALTAARATRVKTHYNKVLKAVGDEQTAVARTLSDLADLNKKSKAQVFDNAARHDAAPNGAAPNVELSPDVRKHLKDLKLLKKRNLAGDETVPQLQPQLAQRQTPLPHITNETNIHALEDIIRELITAIDPKAAPAFRKGITAKFRNLKAIGTFNRRSGVIRMQNTSDLATLTHELGHYYETRFGQVLARLKQAHSAELVPMRYPGTRPGTELSEGFAEFLRIYVTDPNDALSRAPGFAEAFERFLAEQPGDLLKTLHSVRDKYAEWVAATIEQPRAAVQSDMIPTADKPGMAEELASEIDKVGFVNAVQIYANRLYTATVDKLHPINVAVKQLLETHAYVHGSRIDLMVSENAYVLGRLAADAANAGISALRNGITKRGMPAPTGVAFTKALDTAFGTSKHIAQERFDEFGAYLISRRAVGEWDRYHAREIPNPPTKMLKQTYVAAIQEFEQLNPTWRAAADQMYSYLDDLLELKWHAGLISEELFDTLSVRGIDYVPFMRDMKDFGESVGVDVLPRGFAGADKTGRAAVMMAFRGSERRIINPLDSIVRDTIATHKIIARNDMFSALARQAENLAGYGGRVMERIPDKQIQALSVGVDEVLERAMKDAGYSRRDALALTSMVSDVLGEEGVTTTIFRAGSKELAPQPVIFTWSNGKRQAWRLADGDMGRELYRAMTMLGQEHSGAILDTLSLTSRAVRAGVTTEPSYLLMNFVRDQVAAWVLTPKYIPFFSGAAGMWEEVTQSKWAKLYNQYGGIMGGAEVSSFNPNRVNANLNRLRAKGYKTHVLSLRDPKSIFKLMELSETGTRIAIFKKAYKRAMKMNGGDERLALMEAAFTARDFIDFGRHGSKTMMARRLVPFLNAGVQGMDKGIRATIAPLFKLRHGHSNLTAAEKRGVRDALWTWAKLMQVGLAGVGLRAIYADDPEFQEINDLIRHTHWPVKLADGEWGVIPKPFELAMFSNVFERGFEKYFLDDASALESMMEGLGEIFTPPHDTPLATLAELYFGVDSFTGRDIIPERVKGLEPEEMYTEYTSELGRMIGKQLGVSPMYVDHAIKGFGATWGRNLLLAFEKGEGRPDTQSYADRMITRRFVKKVTRGSNSELKFWELMNRDQGALFVAANQFKTFVDAGQSERALEYIGGKSEDERAYAMLTYHGSPEKRLHPINRAQDMVSVISKFRRELYSNTITPTGRNKLDYMTPGQRGAVDTIISYVKMVAYRNALVAAGVRGWENKERMSEDDLWDELETLNPQVYKELQTRLDKKKVYSEKAVLELWPRAKEIVLADPFKSEAKLKRLTALARTRSRR